MTQEELSYRSKMPASQISNTENGKHNLSFESIDRLLVALNVDWAEFGAALEGARKGGQ